MYIFLREMIYTRASRLNLPAAPWGPVAEGVPEADPEPGLVGVSAAREWSPLQPRRPLQLRSARNHFKRLI